MSDNEGHCLSKRIDELEAELAEKDEIIKLLEGPSDQIFLDTVRDCKDKDKRIAALTARIKAMGEEWQASMCIPCEVSVCDVMNKNYRYQKDIKALQAEIAEKDEDYKYLKQLFEVENKAHNEWMNKCAALQARIKAMEEEWKESICIPCEVSVCDVMNKNYRYQKDITALQAKIKELLKEG